LRQRHFTSCLRLHTGLSEHGRHATQPAMPPQIISQAVADAISDSCRRHIRYVREYHIRLPEGHGGSKEKAARQRRLQGIRRFIPPGEGHHLETGALPPPATVARYQAVSFSIPNFRRHKPPPRLPGPSFLSPSPSSECPRLT